ncbi:hypothetical protein BATDEDRAFT_91203 [Batrachochytrium dendrobatidis JAM81]|uniref:Dynein axonemal heavy chain 2 n=1 Tax=Batrachochytrium dendrobatidis (strain JAM81 / FGSC 10211) TaxID=684364 RepID=F4P9W6_BATDJ|nr:uncharacterized protein BATDEDRAFT_91203 [Batrachochytrium dendrobatidis JAM81]EGF78014.1 hypothetical protein BATDEDRAFT_91203 [Batrachochytrium dendrobatidis JAM81]|eukprot:XP_006681548.1 hypothetical protein BATDEDRAFT_91203 [Batrachochytrium dendrobatidis JAM81]
MLALDNVENQMSGADLEQQPLNESNTALNDNMDSNTPNEVSPTLAKSEQGSEKYLAKKLTESKQASTALLTFDATENSRHSLNVSEEAPIQDDALVENESRFSKTSAISYTDACFLDCLKRIKKVITLENYDEKMWTPEHENTLREFICSPSLSKVVMFMDEANNSPQFIVQAALPTTSNHFKELMYFIRDSLIDGEILTKTNFEQKVQYGSVSKNAADGLLRLMQGVYVPVFLENKRWPDSVRKEFNSQLHKFMAFLTDTTFQMKGHTVLYVPKEDLSVSETTLKSNDVVQRLESLLIHWTRQIKDVVNNQHTLETTENSGPLQEIQFWSSRCDDLSGISKQLDRPDVQQIIRALEMAKSSYLEQFLRLSNLIHEGTIQAQDNLKFLSTLQEPCQLLAEAEPKNIPEILPKLLNCIRLIWANSKYYNTKERMTSLMRKVSNEIIRRCCVKISLEDIFHGDVQTSMSSLQDSIVCGESWKQIYKRTCNHIAKYSKGSWDLDQSSIFAQIDAFVQRCRDLLEVCEGQIQFARKLSGGEKAPIPFFGGSHGSEIAKSLEDIELAFEKLLSNLWDIRWHILNVKATRWHDDYNSFKQGVKDLEVMMQNVIISAFENAMTVETGVELLDIFHHLAKREAIKRTVEKKNADVYQILLQELNIVKIEFETHRKTPDVLRSQPDYAGSAYWARALLRRIQVSMGCLSNAYYLPYTILSEEAKAQFEPLAASLEEYISRTHTEWVASLGTALAEKLEGVLMTHKPGERLEMKFDKDLSRLFSEITYFQKLKCDIPFHVQEIYSKKEELRILKENVLLVIRDYNTIMETITPEQHWIFKERIRFLDRKINPGVTSLTWASKGISEFFVKECRRHSHDVQRTVSDFLEADKRIHMHCQTIAQTSLWQIENKRIYDLETFKQLQQNHQAIMQERLSSACQEIKSTLEQAYEVFRNDGKDVYSHWIRYIESIDTKLEDALRSAVRRSLLEISKAINGEGKNRDGGCEVHPLFKVNVILDTQKVDFSPTLQRLEDTVNRFAQDMISTVKVIPRLAELLITDALHSNRSSAYNVISSEEDIIKILSGIQVGMSSNATKCQAYLRNWDSYREIWEINKDAFIRRYAKLKPALSTFDADINRYNEVANNTQKEETLTNVNFIRLDCSLLKHELVSHCSAWQNKLTALLNANAAAELNNLYDMFVKKTDKLCSPPKDLEQLSESLSLLAQLQLDSPTIEAQFAPIHEMYDVLEKYEVHINDEEKARLESLPETWAAFLKTISESEHRLHESKSKFKTELLNAIDEFSKQTASMRDDLATKGPFLSSIGADRAIRAITDYRSALALAANQERSLKKGLAVFKIEHPPSKDMESIAADLDSLFQIWQTTQEWNQIYDGWRWNPFLSLDSSEIEDTVQKFIRKLGKMGKEMKDWDVFTSLKESINQTKRTIPLLLDLRNPAMRDRHWGQIMDEIGKSFNFQNSDFTLDKILELGLDQHTEAISILSTAATKELSIEQALATINDSWLVMDLDLVLYKEDRGYYKIKSTETLFELLEDNQVTLSSMKASKFFSSFQAQVDHWERTLSHVVEVVEILLLVQRQWIYLENIFVGTEDIRKQLPKESAVFDSVNTAWADMLRQIHHDRNALRATHSPKILESLIEMNAQLEKIQKSLDMYLETKRQAFPRFYFLSNDDLLEILGQAKDPNAVQSHLKKCFDNIHKLELVMAGVDGHRHNEALGMYSGDGEYVQFSSPVIVEGPIEMWLVEIESAMRTTLRKLLPQCLNSLKKAKRDKWLKDWAGMLLITAGLISWTSDCTKSLQEIEKGEKSALKNLKKKQASSLKRLADLVRCPLGRIDRKKLIALITVEVHSRDVIDKMAKTGCSSTNAFEWLSQLRYYWEKEGKDDEDCYIRQINTHFRFGYEYLGNSGRLVITPLTDRCYMTLTTALHLFRGGSPQGPAGTGKTETVKDLGKALGKFVIVQNCSKALDYKSIGRMFSGLAQTGAWGCFDEFNRIDIEVLSVVALQISCILTAISRNSKIFVFEGKEIRLDTSCGIFITMNPGYAGRVELPDNLKSLFRPVSMMVPDSALIAEIMLFAEGFSNTRVLSKKVETLYRLAIQQLSKQDHYDFGLRALTSALKSAGTRKRLDLNAPDDAVLYLAMRDSSLPKLTAEDVPLFLGILSDLFPGVEASPIDSTELRNAISEELKSSNMVQIDSIISKVIQLFETKVSRHGVMIVGNTGSGKSTVWKTLQGMFGRLEKTFPERYSTVKTFLLNPKALSLEELYGEFNIATNEWSDGVLSNLMRSACSDERRDQKWIVLDGPVDTLWIESMNTVLDDNKVLTLINGERIALPEQVSLLFEVENLSTASPATVSRCGMIYMDYEDLGWKPFMESWVFSRGDDQSAEILRRLIEKYIAQTLEIRKTCMEIVPVPESSAIKSFCKLFDCVATMENGVNPEDPDTYNRMLELWFLFSVIWSIGGSLTDESRKKFDSFLREIEGQFSSKDTVFEYYVDKQSKGWGHWEDKLQSGWRYSSSLPFYKIFVPSIDTIRNEFILKSLVNKRSPVLLVGDVGTGKTSLIQNSILTSETGYSQLVVNMSAQTSSDRLQGYIEGKLEKRTKNIFVPIGGKSLLMFIDDFNMPMKDDFGSQPPLEFIRHWMDYGFCYDRQKQTLKYLNDIFVIAAMGPPGGGRNSLSPRIQARFNVLNMTLPSETSVFRIFSSIVNQKLQDFEEDVKPLGDIITHSTIEIYNAVVSQLLPTPAKIHYLFNLRDISKVFQGILRANREYYDSRETMTKLWVHEIMRVFNDRLVDKPDRDYFSKLLDDKLNSHFSTSLQQLCGPKRKSIFGDFLNVSADNFLYEEISDHEKLKHFMQEKLLEYNSESGFVQANLVLFFDAIEHICRITRVLRQPCGNVLLIGVGGSGRQSLARVASYIVDTAVFQIEISKHYRHADFREDLKKLYRTTGLDNKPTTFLFTDAHVINSSFLEDMSNILSSGEVPNMFSPEELLDIKQSILPMCKAGDTGDALYTTFMERVRRNLHVVLCMSPVGDAFRNRLRMFPSLINCTTIDWFSEWPEDALQDVALSFLADVNLGTEQTKRAISQIFVAMHTSVVEMSAKMVTELKRYNFVTPTNYLELVTGYKELLLQKRREIGNSAQKLQSGLSKLDDTRQNVEQISVELEVSKKQVSQYQKQCEDYLVVIVQQKREADEQAKSVSAKAEKLGVEEEEVRAVAEAAQADLDQAIPALNAAVKALEAINKKDLNEIRSYGKPPPLVEKVMEGVMVLKKCEPTWEEAKRQLGNPYFIKQLVNFDKDNISDKILKRISQYCADENFQPDIVGRVSGASKSLCMWVRAMETYGTIFRQVAPKKEKLRVAQETLEKKQKTLREAKFKLQEIQDKLVELKTQYDEKVTLKEKLRQESEQTEVKLSRAEKLVSGLSGERDRWEKSIQQYEEALCCLPGDCLLAAAFLSYAGPFNSVYRQSLSNGIWLAQIKALEIPFTAEFSFDKFIGKATDIREWSIQGLPSDSFSAENGIIVTRGRRWPLMIDPQGQANSWIKNMEQKRDLKVIDLKQHDYLRTLEKAIQFGTPVLLQGVLDVLDPSFDSILNKSIVKKGGILTIKLGDKDVEYHPDFKFYITTKLANPKYSPEIFSKVTIVNFAVKEKGLEDQLLGITVCREKPELEEQKNALVVNVATAKRRLIELEDEILHLLSTAQGSLLDDEKLVYTLQSSKSIADDVNQQLIVSEQTEKRIDAAREGYRSAAQRASILYFVLNDLGSVDFMYQFSLDTYIELFEKSIAKSKKYEDISERIASLNDFHTYSVYKNTCRGLFEKHKTLFSFQMTVKILEASGKLNRAEYNFLLRGGQVLDKDSQPTNPCTEWITDSAWDNLTELDALVATSGIISSIEQSERDWKAWFMSSEPDEIALPGDWENKLNDLQKMLIVRSLRPDRIPFCATTFVANNLGQKFVEPPILDMQDILAESSPKTPLIFVLSPGVDPTSALLQLAKKKGMTERFQFLSLGQGQAPKATRMIQDALRDGGWVFLANCHFSISWIATLDKIIESIPSENPHPDFRLWLSSSPHPDFPISILQCSLKMTTEPPKGLKANLTRLFDTTITDDIFSRCTKSDVYQKLIFSLSMFHSILLERKKFQTLGWNVVCEFSDSDFDICENIMVVLLDEYENVPWDALKYLIAEANYGGRVTDDWDRRILRGYINQYFNDDVITTPLYHLSSMPHYYIPEHTELFSYREYIATLPSIDKPEVFGQHPNADIASQIRESGYLLETLISLQPQIVTKSSVSREDTVFGISADIIKRIPKDIDFEATLQTFKNEKNPFSVVLFQEIKRYNDLLQNIRKSLADLQNSIKGIVVMTSELEETLIAIYEGRVPPNWSQAYASLKPLASWIRDLIQRIQFFVDWSKGNEPKQFWLGAFTFPTGFLTAVLQKAARKSGISVDVLSWEFLVVPDDEPISSSAKDGVYIRGLFLEGAGWDKKNNCLCEPKPMELITPLPSIQFKPIEARKKANRGLYTCPLYYFPIRSGTRERPSFINSMDLKSGLHDQDYWVKRGTAALASLG